MSYKLGFTSKAKKQFEKLDTYTQEQISRYIEKHFCDDLVDPRSHGKPLTGKLKGYWRYETGKYRLICDIQDGILLVLVIKIGHRREVYRG